MTDPELLDCAPTYAVDHEVDEELDRVILLQPRFRWRLLQRLLTPHPSQRHVKIHLDALGTWVWRHLDGETPLRDLVADIEAEFPEEPDAARRLLLFVRQLAGNRLINLGGS